MIRHVLFVALALALCGCAATSDQARASLSAEYVGHSVDDLVTRFGPPTSAFKMGTGSTAYSWNIANSTSIDVNKYGGSAQSFTCTLQVIADPAGKITSFNTTDTQNSLGESLCAKRLGFQRQY